MIAVSMKRNCKEKGLKTANKLFKNLRQLIGEPAASRVQPIGDLGELRRNAHAVFVERRSRHVADRLFPAEYNIFFLGAQLVREIADPFEAGKRDIMTEA